MKTKTNIYLIYIYIFLSTFILFYSCDTLFYLEKGISSSGYMLFVTITFLVQIILEIPSGVIADKYSRKKILLLSNSLFIISTLIFIFSNNYYLFVLAIIIKGIDNALVTGIANSLLYDSLEESSKFNKILFNKNFFYNLSYMLAMILGGYIGQKYGLITTYYLTLIPYFINFIVILSIKDIKKSEIKNNMYLNKDILKNAIQEIKNSKIIINLIFTTSIIFSVIKLVEETHPEYSSKIGISIFEIGIYTSLILVFCILGSYIGSKMKLKYHKYIILGNSFLVGFLILLIGLSNNKLGILFLLAIYIFSESYENIMLTTIHSNISSKSRVTIESILSMSLSLCGVTLSGIMTILLKYIQVYQLYIILGLIVIIYSVINLIVSRKNVVVSRNYSR